MKKIKQGYNIVFLWNKKEPIENICFQEVHKEIVEIFKEADLFEKNQFIFQKSIDKKILFVKIIIVTIIDMEVI